MKIIETKLFNFIFSVKNPVNKKCKYNTNQCCCNDKNKFVTLIIFQSRNKADYFVKHSENENTNNQYEEN